jgi:hypothetical protein
MRMRLIALALLVAVCGCRRPADEKRPVIDPKPSAEKLQLIKPDTAAAPHLHNLLQLTDRIYSGSEPHGEGAFAELAGLGVKVIVSVDGTRPDVEAARKYGLRYVHIPIGYDGVPEEAGLALARVVRETGAAGEAIYFHCHHGKHRGPAAAAVACIAAEAADHAAAEQVLIMAGTSRDYPGLWRDVAEYSPPPSGAQLPQLVEVARVDSIVTAMSSIDRSFDNLKLLETADWQPLADHPDLVAAQEALMLKESLFETGRNLSAGYDEEFATWLREAEIEAAALETALRTNDAAGATRALLKLDAACKQCHTKYRN